MRNINNTNIIKNERNLSKLIYYNFFDKYYKKMPNVVLGVTGGIAVYKSLDVVSRLKKLDVDVNVIMTKSATNFVNPLSFQSLSQNYVVCDMFEEVKTWDVEHISLAKKADVFLIAPATANFIGKLANGISDDMLLTTVMATNTKVVICPAMNTQMYKNKIVQDNIKKLESLGYIFIKPQSGRLACGDIGEGKLETPEVITEKVLEILNQEKKKDLLGKNILITAGPTVESIDPMRFISNRSTGKMGYSIVKSAINRGANVTLVSGPTNLEIPNGLTKLIKVESAAEMFNEVIKNVSKNDIIIKTAAVADYTIRNYSDDKLKKSDDDLTLELVRTKDIAKEVGKIKDGRILVGFAAETNNLVKNAKTKIKKKNMDFIVLNDLKEEGAGFSVDTNIVKIIDIDGNIEDFPKMKKEDVAEIILDKIVSIKK